MLRGITLTLLSLVIGTALFVWVLNVVGWEQILVAISAFFAPGGLIVILLSVAALLVEVWRWKRIMKSMGHDIAFRGLWQATFASFPIKFFIPQLVVGSELFQGYFLNKKFDVPLPQAVASTVVQRIMELTWNALVVTLGAIFFVLFIGLPSRQMMFLFGGVFLVMGALLAFFYIRTLRRESIVRIFIKRASGKNHAIETEREVFRFFSPKRRHVWEGFAITALRGLIHLARVWFILFLLGKSVGFLPAFSVLGIFYFAMFFPIPAALGSHDALQAFLFGALGLGAGTGAAFAFMVRAADLLIAVAGAALLLRLGLDLIKTALFRRAERIIGG